MSSPFIQCSSNCPPLKEQLTPRIGPTAAYLPEEPLTLVGFDKQETRKAQLFTGQLNVRRKHRKCGAAEIGHPFVCLKLEGSENVIKVNQTLKVEVKTHPVRRAFLSTECRPALK